ncbi:ribonuclease H-like domain-containing protein, partial [Tanacetum coccineum]
GIKREFSIARTPQQNGVAERRNRTLIEAVRTIMVGRTCNIKRGQDTKIPQSGGPPIKVGDEAIHKELGDIMERAATTTSSLEAEQDSEKELWRINIDDGNAFCNEIEVNAVTAVGLLTTVRHKLMLLRFWATAKVKTVNGERQLQALVDKKKVLIIETSIRSDLNLEDAGGTNCLPTATIFEELARMRNEKPSPKLTFYKAFFSPQWKFLIYTITQCLSAKTTAWNEFSSTMASAIICLATNQKFNLSNLVICHITRRLMLTPNTQRKSNMKREGKDFSVRVTPLFATMMVQANQEEGVDSDIPTDSQKTPITTQPSTSKPQKKQSRRK